MPNRHLRLGAVALAVAAALAGCGSSSSSSSSSGNSISSKSPQQILNASNRAAQSARSVHVAGSMASNGQPLTLDLNLVNGKGASGTISTSGFTVDIIDVAHTVYLKGSNSFWQHFGGKAAAQLFQGKWLKAPASGNFAAFAQFTDLSQLFQRILSSHGKLAKGPQTTMAGQKVITIKDVSKGGALYVATTGKPYPVALSKPGSGGGTVRFTNYDQPVSLSAPANAVDISQFQQTAK